MNEHYSDFAAKSAPVSDIVFNKVAPEDKKLVNRIRKIHIKRNIPLLLIMTFCFLGFGWYFIRCIFERAGSLFIDVFSIVLLFIAVAVAFYYICDVIGPFWRLRKGIVISSERMESTRHTGNVTYQYYFDIFLDDTDQTMMNFQVDREVFTDIDPGDGVVLIKNFKKIRVFADPDRIAVMDVSRIKSGVDYKR